MIQVKVTIVEVKVNTVSGEAPERYQQETPINGGSARTRLFCSSRFRETASAYQDGVSRRTTSLGVEGLGVQGLGVKGFGVWR